MHTRFVIVVEILKLVLSIVKISPQYRKEPLVTTDTIIGANSYWEIETVHVVKLVMIIYIYVYHQSHIIS